MGELEQVSTLIGDIYDASLDPALWPLVLEKSASFVGGVASSLFITEQLVRPALRHRPRPTEPPTRNSPDVS